MVGRERSTLVEAAAWRGAPLAALVVGSGGRIEAANSAAERLVGSGLGGRSLFELIPGRHRSHLIGLTDTATSAAGGSTSWMASVQPFDRPPVAVRIVASPVSPATVGLDQAQDGHALLVQFVEQDGEPTEHRLTHQRAFRSAILQLSELSHETDDDDEFFQALIETAVAVVPGAQAGSVLVRRPGTNQLHFAAAHGYDLTGLQQRYLTDEEFFRDTSDPAARIVRDIDANVSDPERRRWLVAVGRIDEIVVAVSAPVVVGGVSVAIISLDNFDDPDAFSDASVEMTTVLGRLIADLWRRRQLEAELRREREAYRHQALHDMLTGLANRRHLEDRLDQALAAARRRARPVALLFVDVDDFKTVNDQHGHSIGDRVLVEVAERLRRTTRADDTVGRWGGDEFVIVTEAETAADAEALASRVLAGFEAPVVLGATSLPIRVSVGATWCPDGSIDREAWVRSADAALYRSKALGKAAACINTADDGATNDGSPLDK